MKVKIVHVIVKMMKIVQEVRNVVMMNARIQKNASTLTQMVHVLRTKSVQIMRSVAFTMDKYLGNARLRTNVIVIAKEMKIVL